MLSSYDPNDKWVSRDTLLPWEIASEEYLYYRIRFQNTGTYAAINILVRDTLDEKLDWNTLQTISSSHSYNISVTNGNAVEWTFSNIMLPDSNANEPESHGFIYYRIRHKNTLNIGDNISNTAAIFFDYNEPVITNTVTTTVAHTTSVNDTKYEFVRIFPNPCN